MRHPDEGRITVNKTNSRISKPAAIMALVLLALGVTLALSLPDGSRAVAQPAGQVQSLRGETAIPDENLAPEIQRIFPGTAAFVYPAPPGWRRSI